MFFDFKKYFKNNRQFIALIFAAVVFLFIYAWFPVYTTLSSTSFASPDETANYFWIERVANEEVLQYFEPLNVIANDAVVPRSVRSDNGVVKPVSFLGIILIYGVIAKFLGMWLVPFLTPLLAVLGVLFFYGIVSEIFAEKKALLSALLLFSLAPYWYYASRGLFHNVLFVDLVLAGGYLFIISRDAIYRVSTQWLLIFSSGICFGLAIMTRASELIWIAPAGIIIVAAYGKKIHWRKAVLFFCGLVLVVTPMFYCNHALYGGALNFGYEQRENKVVADEFNNTIVADTVETQDVVSLRNFVLPFGFHPRAVWHNFLNYYVKIFWYLFWPALLGGILFIWKWKEKSKAQKLYFGIFILTSVILGVYYGSWAIQDSIALNPITIGNSYTRYWLPMYILSLPLAAEFIFWLVKFLKNKYAQYALLVLLIAGLTMLNFQTAVFGKGEGLYATAQNIALDGARAAQVLTLMPDDAVIATKYFDKYFWPARKVISTDLSAEQKNQAIAALLKNNVPVYYYGFIFAPGDFAYLNNVIFRDLGMELEIIMLDEESKMGLYKFALVK